MGTHLFVAKRLVAVASLVILVGVIGFAQAESTPTPTPHPTPTGKQSLTDVAKNKKLNTDAAGDPGAPIVITNENLDDYASKGGLTEIKGSIKNVAEGPHAAGVVMVDPVAHEAEQRKYYWQQMYAQQLSKISSLKLASIRK